MNEFKELHNELDKLIVTTKELVKEIKEERKLYPKPTEANPYPLIPPNPPAPYKSSDKGEQE